MGRRAASLATTAALSLLAVASTSIAQPGRPPIPAGHNVRYYEVSGLTLEDLSSSLDARGPIGPNGIRAYGLTEWYVSWRYVPWRHDGICELIHVSTEIRTKLTLPRWVDEAHASPSLAKQWALFYESLTEHEEGHLERGRAAERDIAKALSKLTPAKGCVAAARAADDAALEILWKHQALDRKYDRDTRYGRDQYEKLLSAEK